jgi:hypothetical protein
MIERYISGELSPIEIDEIWIGFLQYPELFEYFITELHLRNHNLIFKMDTSAKSET